jgi:hypothetical protein
MILPIEGELERAYFNASRVLWGRCGHGIVTPRMFGARWAREYGCRHVDNPMSEVQCLEFDDGADYLMFVLKWA